MSFFFNDGFYNMVLLCSRDIVVKYYDMILIFLIRLFIILFGIIIVFMKEGYNIIVFILMFIIF